MSSGSKGFARLATGATLGLCVAAGVGLALPPTAFRAKAVVAVTDIGSPLSAILPRAAADAAVSEPVMLRTAQSLIGTNVPVPAPNVLEQIAVTLGLGGAHATGQAARLATDLADMVTAKPGEIPGSLEISARSPDADRAAQIANALAEALVADQDDELVQARRKREIDAIAQVERLKAQAGAARRRLAALGGVEADPAQIRDAAVAQTANVQARVDTIRAIIASGTPPLSDRRDVPSGIETLQTTYLDLTRQLAKARETLGDRHTTIISLQAEVKHAAASLTAEWHRLSRLAETELATARQREAMIRRADTPADATRRDAIEEARRSVQIADDTVARAQSTQHEMPLDERGYRLLARAPLPTVANGFGAMMRALIAGAAGLFAFWIGRQLPVPVDSRPLLSRSRARRDEDRVAEPDTRPAIHVPVSLRPAKAKAAKAKSSHPKPATHGEAADVALRRAMKRREKTLRDIARDLERDLERDVESDFGGDTDPAGNVHSFPQPAEATALEPDDELIQSMADLLPRLDAIRPRFGAAPTVMVAANEMAAGTMPVALAFGRAAADVGYRVLVVETARSRAELATAADVDADPVLIDLFGALRVALPAEAADGFLYLAPNLEQGARLASDLARLGDTPLVDDIAAEFDLIVIDGGRAADSAAAGWEADAYVRVGRFAAERDDDRFAATFGVSTNALLGTIVASVFPPKLPRKPVPQPSDAPAQGHSPNARTQKMSYGVAPSSRPLHGRPAAPRRTVGARAGGSGR